jgi:enediyne biosynthesis protein E4
MFPPPPPPQDAVFVDTTAEALPDIVTTCGGTDKRWILEVNGPGLALEDFDGDGHIDLLLVDGSTMDRVLADEPGLPPRLFLGDGRGGFSPGGEAWAIPGRRWGTGVAVGDLNGDGRPDLVIGEWGPDRVLLNQEGGGFKEVDAGLSGEGWSTSIALFDADGDGRLDLFITGYLECDPRRVPPAGKADARWKGRPVMLGPEGMTPIADRLYRGLGDGRFELLPLPEVPAAYGLGVVVLDLEGDGDRDLFVANDSMPNHLYVNDGAGGFSEQAFARGVAYDANGREQAGMGIARGDLDGDGRLDLFVTNFSGEANAYYRSSSRPGRFRERGAQAGLVGPSLQRLGWGTGAGDLDLDGDLDLFVLNGHVYPQADGAGTDTRYAQPDQVLLQGADGRFVEQRLDPGAPRCSRAGALADLDGDGDLDLVTTAVEGPVRVWRNTSAGPRGRGMVLRLKGRGPNTAALGARVEASLRLDGRARTLVREVSTTGGFQAALPAAVHLGVAGADHLDELVVRWPSGQVSRLRDVAVVPSLTLEEPEPVR